MKGRRKSVVLVKLLVYVDDILIGYNSEEEFNKVYASLSKEFEMANLGDANYFREWKFGWRVAITAVRKKVHRSDRCAERFELGDANCVKMDSSRLAKTVIR